MGHAVLVSVLLSTPVHAGVLPDIGDALRESERPPPGPPAVQGPQIELDLEVDTALDRDAGVELTVESIRLTGVTRLDEGELLELVRPYTGRTVTLGELREAAGLVTRRFRDRGYLLARAYIPAQEVRGGIVEFSVLEGRYGGIFLKEGTSLSPRLVQQAVAGLRSGDAIEQEKLDRALLLLDGLDGIAARGTLSPGELVGSADLRVDLTGEKRAGGTLRVDNYGIGVTGRWRLGADAYAHNITGHGDSLSARGVVSDDADVAYANVGYDIPLTGSGWRTGVSATYSEYDVGGSLANLDARGDAVIGSAYVQYPLVLSRNGRLQAAATLEYKDMEDRIEAAGTRNPRSAWLAGIRLQGYLANHRFGSGVTHAEASVDFGSLSFDDPVSRAIDGATANTAGGFSRINYSLMHVQDLAAHWQLYASLFGQVAFDNMDPAEKLALGGPFGVRAYPSGEASGDEGLLGTLEMRYQQPLPWHAVVLRFSAFLDAGTVWLSNTPYTTTENRRSLGAAGIGAELMAWKGMELRLNYAWRLGNEPALSDDGDSSRGWVLISKTF